MQPSAFGGFGTHAPGTTIQSVISRWHLRRETCTNEHGKTTRMLPLLKFEFGEVEKACCSAEFNVPTCCNIGSSVSCAEKDQAFSGQHPCSTKGYLLQLCLLKLSPPNQAKVNISVLFSGCSKQKPGFAQGQPKGYFPTKEHDRATDSTWLPISPRLPSKKRMSIGTVSWKCWAKHAEPIFTNLRPRSAFKSMSLLGFKKRNRLRAFGRTSRPFLRGPQPRDVDALACAKEL